MVSQATELLGDHNIPTAGVARAMEVLHFWERSTANTTCVPETFPTEVDVAAQQLQQQLREHASSTVAKVKLALEEALPKLEEVVFGKRGGSWKDKLTEASPWEDVLREAACHLLGGEQGPIADRLTPIYTEAQQAYQPYKAAVSRGTSISGDSVVSLDEGLARRCDAGLAAALVTDTGAFLCGAAEHRARGQARWETEEPHRCHGEEGRRPG